MLQNASLVGCLVLLTVFVAAAGPVQPAEPIHLYECVDISDTVPTLADATLCNARATSDLTRRAEADNLQVREGALVVEVDQSGGGGVAGLQPGDVIYRVGGVDVTDAESAALRLMSLAAASDTVVNFLRGGRPYRVKLRLN